MIMCGTCDMGRKKFFLGLIPPPPGVPPKKYPTRYQSFFLPSPLDRGVAVCAPLCPREGGNGPLGPPTPSVLLPQSYCRLQSGSLRAVHRSLYTVKPWTRHSRGVKIWHLPHNDLVTQWRSKPVHTMEIQAGSHNRDLRPVHTMEIRSQFTQWRSKSAHKSFVGTPSTLHGLCVLLYLQPKAYI